MTISEMLLPLEYPGADDTHGVGLVPQAVLGQVVLQQRQPHLVAVHGTSLQSSVHAIHLLVGLTSCSQ